ncbi:MAG: hypothetical protein ACI9TY_001186 [Alphaproteobacteria bacterium]|jgi:hypothetical protein
MTYEDIKKMAVKAVDSSKIVLNTLDKVKDINEQLQSVELKEEILNLREAMLSIREENVDLKEAIFEMDIREKAVRESEGRVIKFEGDDTPYCPSCYDTQKI